MSSYILFCHTISVIVVPIAVVNWISNTKVLQLEFLYVLIHSSDATSISSKGSHVPSMKPSIETATRRGAMEMACVGDVPLIRNRITLFDLYEALQVSNRH